MKTYHIPCICLDINKAESFLSGHSEIIKDEKDHNFNTFNNKTTIDYARLFASEEAAIDFLLDNKLKAFVVSIKRTVSIKDVLFQNVS